MHYINGREAKEGDSVIHYDKYAKGFRVGMIHSLSAQSQTCNAQLARIIPGGVAPVSVTLSECIHIEDAFNAAVPELPTA